MKLRHTSIALVGLTLTSAAFTSGCGEQDDTTSAASSTSPPEQPVVDSLAVAADGTRFDPSVAAARIPDDTWFCDMNGQVHYASREPGDGECPICSMALVHKDASGSVAPHEHSQGAEGHEEDEGHH